LFYSKLSILADNGKHSFDPGTHGAQQALATSDRQKPNRLINFTEGSHGPQNIEVESYSNHRGNHFLTKIP